MTVALISERGVRLMEVPILHAEIRLAEPSPARVPVGRRPVTLPARRFVRMDEHTYVEKD